MTGTSRPVDTSQAGPHRGLAHRVLRQAGAPWRKPVQAVDAPALATLDAALDAHIGPAILDSFCGTGHSSAELARMHPAALVIGVDQSLHRLRRSPDLPDNCLLLQAHCEAVWRHLVERDARLLEHWILYPNPWPKPGHLGRRVHGHPAFGLLPRLSGRLELRSNWQIYVEEFGLALNLLGHPSRIAVVDERARPTTRFEEKYRASGHVLWRLDATLGPPPGS